MPRTQATIFRDIAITIVAAVVFLWLALTVSATPGPVFFDSAVRDAVHGWATPGLTSVMKVVTNFGSAWYLLPVAAAIALCLTMENRRRQAALFAVAVAGGYVFENGLKFVIHRIRPEPFFDYAKPQTYSFPSGHAVLSLCFYLALASVVAAPAWALPKRLAVWAVAALMTLWIGLSRIYLGVHYPTDVLGGYAVAIAWIAVMSASFRRRAAQQTDVPPGQPRQ